MLFVPGRGRARAPARELAYYFLPNLFPSSIKVNTAQFFIILSYFQLVLVINLIIQKIILIQESKTI